MNKTIYVLLFLIVISVVNAFDYGYNPENKTCEELRQYAFDETGFDALNCTDGNLSYVQGDFDYFYHGGYDYPTPEIPEFSVVAGAGALFAGIGVYFYRRKS